MSIGDDSRTFFCKGFFTRCGSFRQVMEAVYLAFGGRGASDFRNWLSTTSPSPRAGIVPRFTQFSGPSYRPVFIGEKPRAYRDSEVVYTIAKRDWSAASQCRHSSQKESECE